MGDINTLVVSATLNMQNTVGNNTMTGSSAADAYYIGGVATGRDVISQFGKNDSLIVDSKIFDSNNDGIVSFGTNGFLDLDGGPDTGGDYVVLGGINAKRGVRYLGTTDGFYVYADATVRPKFAQEGTVANNTLNGTAGADVFFYDTALGLNLGSDAISNFGVTDRLVTTSKVFDSNNDGIINFGGDGLLDLPSAGGGIAGDLLVNGTVAISNSAAQPVDHLQFAGQATYFGVTYYVYGLEGSGVGTTLAF